MRSLASLAIRPAHFFPEKFSIAIMCAIRSRPLADPPRIPVGVKFGNTPTTFPQETKVFLTCGKRGVGQGTFMFFLLGLPARKEKNLIFSGNGIIFSPEAGRRARVSEPGAGGLRERPDPGRPPLALRIAHGLEAVPSAGTVHRIVTWFWRYHRHRIFPVIPYNPAPFDHRPAACRSGGACGGV